MITLNSLPEIMKMRAIWARKQILEHPEKAQIDYDELLAWIYNEEDNLWYSIAGNYSRKSPQEKMKERVEQKKRQEEYERKSYQHWSKQYELQQYWSKVRNNILNRDKNICQICYSKGQGKLHIHHILKRTEGGGDTEDNLITVCPKCHARADRKLYSPQWTPEYEDEVL